MYDGDMLTCRGAEEKTFPPYELDEWEVAGDWAFAGRVNGFLAMHNHSGLQLREGGTLRGRVLETSEASARLTVQPGNADEDSNFESFVTRFGHHPRPPIEAPTIPLELHYSSPCCSADFKQSLMDIHYQDYLMQLDSSAEGESDT